MFRKKKIVAMGIILAVSLGLAACGGKQAGDATGGKDDKAAEELAPEFSYVANYLTVPESFQSYNSTFGDKSFYYVKDEYNEDTWESKRTLEKVSFEKGSFGSDVTLCDLKDSEYFSRIATDAAGNVYCYGEENIDVSDPDENADEYSAGNTKKKIVKFDGQGQRVYEAELDSLTKDLDYFYPEHFVVDDQGRIYLYSYDAGIYLFDENGNYAGTVDVNGMNSWLNGIGVARNGKVYAAFQNYTGNSSEYVLNEIIFEEKKFGDPYKNLPGGTGYCNLVRGNDCDLICYDNTAVYEYSLEKQENNKILTWMDCDIDGGSVGSLVPGEDGKLYAFLDDYNTGSTELAEMSKVRTEDIAKREVITVGVIYGDSDLSRKIVDFNKKNDQYRIKLKSYMDPNDWSDTSYNDAVSTLTNDLISGNGPDILDLSGLDVANLANKGVLEDLMPYLEKSTAFSKNDFFDKILDSATYNGKLTYISTGFTLSTMAGKTSVVGNKSGWTLTDLMNLKKAWPNAELIEYADRESILYMMMILNKNSFIDMEKVECHFDSTEFKSLLEFAKTFPEEYDYENQRLTPLKLKDNSLLLTDASFYGFEDVQSVGAYFDGEPYTLIGYPTNDGGNGCIMSPTDSYGMSAKSANKDAAWAFLESLITSEVNSEWNYGFSTIKSKFEEKKAEALEVRYVYDENGEIMKDENGNPVYENGGGWTMIGDNGEEWTFEYRPVTKEEVDVVEKLLSNATMVNTNMDTELMKIITEEAQSYFQGSKSVDDVANVIQNRVNLYLKENN